MRAIIIGATSGIGREVARLLAKDGWQIGIAGRREELLQSLQAEFPEGQVKTAVLDVTDTDAPPVCKASLTNWGEWISTSTAAASDSRMPTSTPT